MGIVSGIFTFKEAGENRTAYWRAIELHSAGQLQDTLSHATCKHNFIPDGVFDVLKRLIGDKNCH